MNSFVLRGLNPELASLVKSKAREERLSVNKWLIGIVRRACGLDKPKLFPEYHDLDPLAGGWSAKDLSVFKEATEGFERVDREMWT